MSFGSIILNWCKKNKRDLPWRHTRDPYLIWLSEIILQQTRVEQGLPYYFRFSEKYPESFMDWLTLWSNLKEGMVVRRKLVYAGMG